MYKNQLQELAQRSCFNLPAYACFREGPDHAPRFKATVNFNGEIFESPNYCSTLRQAEHAAAEVALNTLSRRGPSHSLAARILDETGVCKNLLQETAQRAGVSLPVYTTIRSGPGHLPVFQCIVEVAGRTFVGEAAKTKKQAEKNAAMAAWSAIKQLTSQTPLLLDYEGSEEHDKSNPNALAVYRRDDRAAVVQNTSQIQSSQMFSTPNYGGRSRVRVVNVRDKNRLITDVSSAGQFHPGSSSSSSNHGDRNFEAGQSHGRYLYSQQSTASMGNTGSSLRPAVHQRRVMPVQQRRGLQSRSERFEFNQPLDERGLQSRSERFEYKQPLDERGLPWQSRSERFELKQPLEDRAMSLRSRSERFELKRPVEDYRLPLLSRSDSFERKPQQQLPVEDLRSRLQSRSERFDLRQQQPVEERGFLQSRSERFELKHPLLEEQGLPLQSRNERFEPKYQFLEELHQRDEDDWLRGETFNHPSLEREGAASAAAAPYSDGEENSYRSSPSSSSSPSMWSRSAQWWGSHFPAYTSSAAAAFANTFGLRPASSLAPPVRVRPMVAVCSAPPRRPEVIPHRTPPSTPQSLRDSDPSVDGEAAARLFSQLRL